MEEDFIADSVADAGGSGITPSQQNNTDILNYHLLLPKTLLRLLRQIKTHLVLTRLCTLQRIKKLPLDASPDKDIMETNDTSPSFDTPTITIIRHDFQTAALLNASSEFIKKYPTNRAMIDAVNNLFLETFHSYTGRAHVSGSGDQKRLVTDIPFFIKKDDITALFKKYGNIQSCCLHTRANAKVQQACIVFMMMLFLPNTSSTSNKPSIVIPPACGLLCDIHLAPLVREIGAMAVNVPLSLNSYKLKKWAYITFKSQQMMDAAMEQSIALQKHVLTWELLQNTNKLCHRCAKLGYAPTACPLNNSRGCSRTHNLRPKSNKRKGKDHSVSFSNLRSDGTLSSGSEGSKPLLVDLNCSQIQEILTLLKSLQEDMTNVHARVYALELADQRMSRLEQQVFGHKQDDVTTPDPSDSSCMIIDDHPHNTI
ncbi:hypothetical protein GLOIN_2v1762049 [Rhizophagus irregularis DAOM 181602=DAOM 197198]|nr:hypothetical protein GLOIN_2v1762049 [Rhizophagus irregularis DAOM 181602=DAOM 197198]